MSSAHCYITQNKNLSISQGDASFYFGELKKTTLTWPAINSTATLMYKVTTPFVGWWTVTNLSNLFASFGISEAFLSRTQTISVHNKSLFEYNVPKTRIVLWTQLSPSAFQRPLVIKWDVSANEVESLRTLCDAIEFSCVRFNFIGWFTPNLRIRVMKMNSTTIAASYLSPISPSIDHTSCWIEEEIP